MTLPLDERLRRKGWSESEIASTFNSIYAQKDKHSYYQKMSSPLLYWAGLVVLIIGNLFFAIVLVPILIYLTSFQLYVVISVMALTFGVMFDFLLRDIEEIDEKHHIIAELFIPAIAIITIFVMVNLANAFALRLEIDIVQSPLIITALYIFMFMVPYAVNRVRAK